MWWNKTNAIFGFRALENPISGLRSSTPKFVYTTVIIDCKSNQFIIKQNCTVWGDKILFEKSYIRLRFLLEFLTKNINFKRSVS